MSRLAFPVLAAIVVAMVVTDILRHHTPDLSPLLLPLPEPPRRVLVAVYYDAAGDLLTFHGPGPGQPAWSSVQLDAPAGATLDAAGDVLKVGPDTWTATQCLLMAYWDHPAGLQLAPLDGREGLPVEAGHRAGMPQPDLPGEGPRPVAVYYDADADRLTFRRPGAAPAGGPAARLAVPAGARVSGEDDRLVVGPDARTANESWLRAWRGEAPDLRLTPRHGQEAPRLAPGVLPASRRKGEPVIGGPGGASP